MNNLLSYCGLVDAKIRASDKDLPVQAPSRDRIPQTVAQQQESSRNFQTTQLQVSLKKEDKIVFEKPEKEVKSDKKKQQMAEK